MVKATISANLVLVCSLLVIHVSASSNENRTMVKIEQRGSTYQEHNHEEDLSLMNSTRNTSYYITLGGPPRHPDEQSLVLTLTENYNKFVRPVTNSSNVVILKMGLTLTQIFDMDEKNQVLVTNVWLDQEWNDEFLRWDPRRYDNLTILRLPSEKIWVPDIVLYNNAAEYSENRMQLNAMIRHTGDIFWPIPTKLESSCKIDVTFFPFDAQVCKLKFGSWTYDGFQVNIVKRTEHVDLSNYIVNGEWELVKINTVRSEVLYSCCVEPYPDVTFYIFIQRRILYYMYNIIFPCIMMSALAVLVFCLPPDSGEKITLGVTVLLAFSVFMLSVAEKLPETSEFVPVISVYLTIVMSMTSVSVIMTVFVLNIHHRGPNVQPVPSWLRQAVLIKIGKALCFKSDPEDNEIVECYSNENANYTPGRKVVKATMEDIAYELRYEFQNEMYESYIGGPSAAYRASFSSQHRPSVNPGHFQSQSIDNEGQYKPNYTGFTNYGYTERDTTRETRNGVTYTRASADQSIISNEAILIALKRIISRHESEAETLTLIKEWRRLAQIFDRLLFWLFCFGNIISTFVILVVMPMTQKSSTEAKEQQ